MAAEFNDSNFDQDVISNDKLSVVDCWASWCGPCIALGPIIESIAEEYPDVNVGKLNVDDNSETASKYGIISIPTILFFKGGELVDKHVGLAPKNVLENKIKELSN